MNAEVPDRAAEPGKAGANGSRARLQLDVEEADDLPIEGDQLDASVTVSGPGVSVRAQEEYRLRHQLAAEGFSSGDIQQALVLLRDQVQRVQSGDDPARVHAAQAHWHAAPWYPLLAGTTPQSIAFIADIADYDPAPALAALNCPLLAIFGADDLLVPVEASVRAISNTLKDARHADHAIMVFPCADHNIRVYTGKGPAQVKQGRYTPAERAPGFDELIVTWLQRRLPLGLDLLGGQS